MLALNPKGAVLPPSGSPVKFPLKRAAVFLAGVAFSLALTQAHAQPPKIDFDQGVDASQVLETLRNRTPIIAINKGTLIPLLTALKDSDFSVTGPISGLDLVARIEQSEPYKNALQYPPLIEVLDPVDRDPLMAAWKEINTIRAALLSEADSLEKEDLRLYERAVVIDRNADRLNLRAEKLSAEIDNFNRQCTGRPLPPGEYEACLRWQNDLTRRLREHEAEVLQHNKNVEKWRAEAADFRKRVGTSSKGTPKQKNVSFLGRGLAWEHLKIGPFSNTSAAAARRSNVTRVTIEAQGRNPPVQKSVSLVTKEPVCKSVGEGMLGNLLSQLTESELADRDEAFAKAYGWIRGLPAGGISAPPPKQKTFQNENRRDPQARIDINVWAGTAFITCPCCSK